jgi:hypothetical protein
MSGQDIRASPAQVPPLRARVLIAVAAAVGVLLAATLVLWAHYGGAVFYEMILAGIAACF